MFSTTKLGVTRSLLGIRQVARPHVPFVNLRQSLVAATCKPLNFQNDFSTRSPQQLHHRSPLQFNRFDKGPSRDSFRGNFNRQQFGQMFGGFGGPRFGSRFAPEFLFLKVVFGIVLFTGIFIFVAAPILFIGIPLALLFGAAFIKFKTSANKLKLSQLISKLSGTSLKFRSRLNTILEDVELKKFVNNRIRIFIEDGEQGNVMMDRISNINNISIAAEYSRFLQNWIIDEFGQEKLIIIIGTELYDIDRKILDVVIIATPVGEDGIDDGSFEMVVEVETGRYKFLINDDTTSYGNDDRIIDIKDYDIKDL